MPNKRTQLDEVGNLDAPKGSREWCLAVMLQAKAERHRLDADAKSLGDWLKALQSVEAWKVLGKLSWSSLLVEVELTDQEADALIRSKPGHRAADVIGRAANAKALAPHANQEGELNSRHRVGNTKSVSAGGTTADYLTARIKRDHPEILDRMKAGEFKSVRAAALEAGIVKPTITLPLDVERAAAAIKRHFTAKQVKQILELLCQPN